MRAARGADPRAVAAELEQLRRVERANLDHTACKDPACRWPSVRCSGGVKLERLELEADRELVRSLRRLVGFRGLP